MFDDTYHTIASPSQGVYKEKGSKFLAFAYPVGSTDEVKQYLQQLRKEYFDARHHCYAYILGATKEAYRVNDDGEPSGTAGRPIYGQLLSADLTNTLVVVVRYFGGILLGASGLANAYKVASREALAAATVVERTIDVTYHLHFGYERMNDVMRVLKEMGAQIRGQRFEADCEMEVSVRQSHSVRLYDTLAKLHPIQISS